MRVVIGGYGRVGRFLSHRLEVEGHQTSVIDRDKLAFEDAEDEIAGQMLVGQVFDKETLEAAGIRDADCYVAVTSGDNSNIVSARIAKEYYRVPKVFARIYDPRRAGIYRNFGIPTIAAVEWTSTRLLDMVIHEELDSACQFGNGEVEVLRADIHAGLAGRTVEDLEVTGELRVAAIVRMNEAFLPGEHFELQAGDTVYVSAVRESVGKLERLIGLEE